MRELNRKEGAMVSGGTGSYSNPQHMTGIFATGSQQSSLFLSQWWKMITAEPGWWSSLSTPVSGTNITITSLPPGKMSPHGHHYIFDTAANEKTKRNNPGDLIWKPWETQFGGSKSSKGPFATFKTEWDGIYALGDLLDSSTYFNLSLDAAIKRFAPSKANPTAAYQSFIDTSLGLSGNTTLSSLTNTQFNGLIYYMTVFEGNTIFTAPISGSVGSSPSGSGAAGGGGPSGPGTTRISQR